MGYGAAYASQRSIAIKLHNAEDIQTILHRLIEIPDRPATCTCEYRLFYRTLSSLLRLC